MLQFLKIINAVLSWLIHQRWGQEQNILGWNITTLDNMLLIRQLRCNILTRRIKLRTCSQRLWLIPNSMLWEIDLCCNILYNNYFCSRGSVRIWILYAQNAVQNVLMIFSGVVRGSLVYSFWCEDMSLLCAHWRTEYLVDRWRTRITVILQTAVQQYFWNYFWNCELCRLLNF